MPDILTHALDNPIFPAIGLALAATVGALWVAGTWWAYRDASWRTGSPYLGLLAASWIVVSSPLLLPLSLGVYALVRPQHTAAQGRSSRLVQELVAQLDADAASRCPTCDTSVEPQWLRCPGCASWLAAPCANCGGWSDGSLEICPWCGSENRDAPAVEEHESVAFGVARKSRRRQTRRQHVASMAFDPRQPRSRATSLVEQRPARAGSR